MFYEVDTLTSELNCSKCQERLCEPKTLPCGDTICLDCVSYIYETLIVDTNNYECPVCKEAHVMPEKGLALNKKLVGILALSPTEVYRGNAIELFKKNLELIKKNADSVSFALKNR